MTLPWVEPPGRPDISDEVVAALADYFEAWAHHLLRELDLAVAAGPRDVEVIIEGARDCMATARSLREHYDVDVDKYDRKPPSGA